MKPFQRKGAKSNSQVGKDIEKSAMEFFSNQGLSLQENVSVDIGITERTVVSHLKLVA